jgi:plasmid stability protein
MKAIQYTIRNIPESVNTYLRKRSRLSGKSLNQVIIDELSEKVASPGTKMGVALTWFIGSGVDQATLDALEQEDRVAKELAAKELSDVAGH